MKNQKEYNNIFNQGVEASIKQLEIYRQQPKVVVNEDKTETVEPLPSTSHTFNLMITEFQNKIKELLKWKLPRNYLNGRSVLFWPLCSFECYHQKAVDILLFQKAIG